MMSTIRVGRIIGAALAAAMLLGTGPASADTRYLVGQVTEVDVASRVIVIGDEQYHLGTLLRFTSEFPNEDLVTGVRPGTYVRFNVPSGSGRTITELHVFSSLPE
jgi:hypothetical protein